MGDEPPLLFSNMQVPEELVWQEGCRTRLPRRAGTQDAPGATDSSSGVKGAPVPFIKGQTRNYCGGRSPNTHGERSNADAPEEPSSCLAERAQIRARAGGWAGETRAGRQQRAQIQVLNAPRRAAKGWGSPDRSTGGSKRRINPCQGGEVVV